MLLQPEALRELPLDNLKPDTFQSPLSPEGQPDSLPEFVGWPYESPPETRILYRPEWFEDYYILPNGEYDMGKLERIRVLETQLD